MCTWDTKKRVKESKKKKKWEWKKGLDIGQIRREWRDRKEEIDRLSAEKKYPLILATVHLLVFFFKQRVLSLFTFLWKWRIFLFFFARGNFIKIERERKLNKCNKKNEMKIPVKNNNEII